jgi:hypothetical protein
MHVLSGAVAMVAILLAAGGVSKALQPAATVRSFQTLGWTRSRAGMVRALAVVEVALGAVLVVVGGRWPALVGAVLFAGFTVVSARLLGMGDAAASCGCFGDRSARPSGIHVAVDATATIVLVAAAVTAAPGMVVAWRHQPAQLAVALGLAALGGYLLVAVMSVLPDTLSAVRGEPSVPAHAFRATASRP